MVTVGLTRTTLYGTTIAGAVAAAVGAAVGAGGAGFFFFGGGGATGAPSKSSCMDYFGSGDLGFHGYVECLGRLNLPRPVHLNEAGAGGVEADINLGQPAVAQL